MSFKEKSPLVVALYLPQYYETEYNNKWWEKGYTEWVACKRAKPLYPGHNQPRVPLNNNYYDLSVKENIRWQMNLAKEYGIDGFAIYQYYSCGSKLLDVPVEMIRDDPSLDLPFYLYWANESWRKTWFGQDNTVVWEQKYGTEKDWRIQFDYCLEYFKDKRYIKIDGKPVYAIYNAWAIPEQEKFLSLWDEWAKEAGLPGIYFVKTIGRHDADTKGNFSATVTREPNYTFAHDEKLLEKVKRVTSSRVIDFVKEKNKTPVIPYEERAAIVAALRDVDEVVPQEDKNKLGAWEKYHFDKMFVGSDWEGTPQWEKYEKQLQPHGVEIVYLSHTDGISSTKLTGVIKKILDEQP